jgi:hypothetical protein
MTATTVGAITVPAITDDMSTLEAAYAYAKARLYIGPCERGSKHPGSVIGDKKTRKGWQRHTSRDIQIITSWFAGTDHGVFIHAGRSDLWIADVDNPAQIHPELQQAITELNPPYQATRGDQPGRGHYLFRQPPGLDLGNGLGKLGNGWGEARGRNGVIIVQPSEHGEGGRYQWLRTGPIPVLPDYVADLLPSALDAEEAATDAQVAVFLAEHRGSERPELLAIQIAAWQKKIAAGESRHGTVMGHISGAMKEAKAGLIDAEYAAVAFESIFVPAVMQQPIGPKQTKARSLAAARDEWRGILAWAIAQGIASDPDETRARVAREVPPTVTEVPEDQFEGLLPPKASANGSAPPDGEPEPSKPSWYSRTDDGNALRLVNEHSRHFRRIADMRKWFHWDGARWAQDHEDRAIRAAARHLARQLPDDDADAKRFKHNSTSATGISSCIRVAETDKRISILAAELDSHPHLINTPSGVVDLCTATVRPHDPSLLLTRITAYPVDLEAPHPRWDKFLADTFQSDLELVAYMRRIAGLALSGFVREHVLPFLHGVGANGKTVFANVIQGLLGEADLGGYALSAPDGVPDGGPRQRTSNRDRATPRRPTRNLLRADLRQEVRRNQSQTAYRWRCLNRPIHEGRLLRLPPVPPDRGAVQPPTRCR